MKGDLEHADDALLNALSGGEGEISRWPEDEEFKGFLRSQNVYGTVSQPRLIMALAAAETSLYSSKTEVADLVEGLSLEHVLPQAWEDHWSLEGPEGRELEGAAREQALEARQARLNRLGNLTVVTQPLNASLSNGPWNAKRKALNAHSKLLLNARLTEFERWDEEAIDRHGSWLAEQLAAVWPGPRREAWPNAQGAL